MRFWIANTCHGRSIGRKGTPRFNGPSGLPKPPWWQLTRMHSSRDRTCRTGQSREQVNFAVMLKIHRVASGEDRPACAIKLEGGGAELPFTLRQPRHVTEAYDTTSGDRTRCDNHTETLPLSAVLLLIAADEAVSIRSGDGRKRIPHGVTGDPYPHNFGKELRKR